MKIVERDRRNRVITKVRLRPAVACSSNSIPLCHWRRNRKLGIWNEFDVADTQLGGDFSLRICGRLFAFVSKERVNYCSDGHLLSRVLAMLCMRSDNTIGGFSFSILRALHIFDI